MEGVWYIIRRVGVGRQSLSTPPKSLIRKMNKNREADRTTAEEPGKLYINIHSQSQRKGIRFNIIENSFRKMEFKLLKHTPGYFCFSLELTVIDDRCTRALFPKSVTHKCPALEL